MPELRRDVVFVHIPKTAGTSARSALEQVLKDHVILFDYGQGAKSTPELLQLVHVDKKPEDFRAKFGAPAKGIFLSGHFPAHRYWPSFHAESFVTFLRHPVDRVLSEYVHWINHHEWKGTFEEFLRIPGMCDRLTRMLARVNLDDFGFIGFTEIFENSMAALETFIGAKLPVKALNRGKTENVLGENRDRYRKMTADLSKRDIDLYEGLRAKREKHLAASTMNGTPDDYLGLVRLAEGVATGWLVNTKREEIARVQVSRNNQPLTVIASDRPREYLQKQGLSRTGLCGFRFDLKPHLVPGKPATFAFRALNSTYELSDSPVQIGN